MILGILLLLTISSVFGEDCSTAVSDFTKCIAANTISQNYCDCWKNFKDQASTACTSDEQIPIMYTNCGLAKAGCSSLDCTSAFNPGNCASSITALPLCVSQAGSDKSKQCNCLSTFVSQTNNYCSDTENILVQVATCKAMEAELNCGQSCAISGDHCNIISQLTSGCQTNYTSCGDSDCACYDALNNCMESFHSCGVAEQTTIKACVEKQFGCSSIQGHCDDDISTSVSITDLDDLFKKYNDKFISLWNNRLANWTAAVQTCTHVITTTQITWTVTVNFNETKYTINDILSAILDEFSTTVGVKRSQLNGYVNQGKGKRNLQESTGSLTVTATQPNGSLMVTAFLLPIILLNGLMFLFFH